MYAFRVTFGDTYQSCAWVLALLSSTNIEGITSPDGRILGKMAHSERRGDGVAINIYGEQDIQIFESGVEYFK